ncbi:MAG: hypothetical protein RBR15_01920 [Sphaerochaeta sp.]|nr:hypothetical protein [Sphaerochaeta sp.]
MERGLVGQPFSPLGTIKKEVSAPAVGDVVSVSDFGGGKAALIFASLQGSKQMTVVRYNRPIGVLLSIDAYTQLLKKIEELQRVVQEGKTLCMQVLSLSGKDLAQPEEGAMG